MAVGGEGELATHGLELDIRDRLEGGCRENKGQTDQGSQMDPGVVGCCREGQDSETGIVRLTKNILPCPGWQRRRRLVVGHGGCRVDKGLRNCPQEPGGGRGRDLGASWP